MPGKNEFKVEFKPIDSIPHPLLEDFGTAAKASQEYIEKYVSRAKIRLGAFHKNGLVGFFSAIPHSAREKTGHERLGGFLEITAAYIIPAYRRRRILHKGVFFLVSNAKAAGLKGVFIWGMAAPTLRYFRTQAVSRKRILDRLGFTLYFDTKERQAHGSIEFPLEQHGFLRRPGKKKLKVKHF